MVPPSRYGTEVPVVKRRDGEASPAPLRADARRNRARILVAAEATFAELGVSAPVDEVARRAGVGVGTLYRHFPTKEALFEAILVGRVEALLEEVRRRLDRADPGVALFEIVERVVEMADAKRDLGAALLGAGIDVHSRLDGTFGALREASGTLLARAQEAGQIRSDVGIDDLFALVGATCAACEQGVAATSRRRLLAVVCDGLRAGQPGEPV